MEAATKSNWVFLRGVIREAAHWEPLLPSFQSDFPQSKVYALDLPGTGEHHDKVSPLRVAEILAFLQEQIEERGVPKDEPVYLLAISLGGMIGAEWIRRFPDDFKAAVFVNISLRSVNNPFRRLKPGALATGLRLLMKRDLKERERQVLNLTSALKQNDEKTLKRWVEIQEARPVSTSTLLRQLAAAGGFSTDSWKPQIPVLLLSSEKDKIVQPTCSKEIASHWQCELRTHSTAGHDIPLDDPEWVSHQIKEFVHSL